MYNVCVRFLCYYGCVGLKVAGFCPVDTSSGGLPDDRESI